MSAIDLRYVSAEEVRIWRPEGGAHLRVELLEDRVILNATVRRAFPLSHPETYLSIQEGNGKEVAILRDPEGLDKESKRILAEDLDRRYFTPQILRIAQLKQEAGMWRFTVVTQRGDTEFFVRNWRDSAHEISPNRWQILSVDGQRFEIQDLSKLDARSQAYMELLL